MILVQHPLTREERAAVITYAATVGPDWKHQLANDWMADRTSGIVERLRDTHGAAWLHTFQLTKAELDPLAIIVTIGPLAEACRILIRAYAHNPQQVDWSDVQAALDQALEGFGLPADYPEIVHEVRRTIEEANR